MFARKALGTFVTMLTILAVGCGAEEEPTDEPEETGSEEQALGANAVCHRANIQAEHCRLTRFLLTMAVDGARRDFIARAFSWVEQGVMYSKRGSHSDHNGTYRRDCSGFVSMAWGLDGSYSTRRMAPFDGTFSHALGSYADLRPGDALNRPRPKKGNYHVALFAGWANPERTEFYLLQQLSSGSPAALTKHYWTELGEYTPIRKNGL